MARTRIRLRIRTAITACAATTAALLTAPTAPAAATSGDTVTTTLHQAVADLPIAAEDRTGYRRDLFPHWTDEDQDGCDTRDEVLLEEAVTPPETDSRCTLVGGAWHSYYDKTDHTSARSLGIDHMVPLAEAWDSGASAWSEEDRRAYANDQDDPRSLAAVTAAETRAKGDQDPAQWEPSDDSADCRYTAEWLVVKGRWRLTADRAEAAALEQLAGECEDERITYTRAR
ncbi:GmrSD restriction endonuclease domain-containing protein [Streptomyces sp. P1-3]|uniref:GmrSD restriction endonuclease domain-containing protein n=1 Tax=Streptomyces sp. P1-3 TaxID=3421658 RepID=UPI003D35A369